MLVTVETSSYKYTYLGKRCLGQGMMRISCGMERIKLSSSGKKKSIKVLLNRPRMPLTANVMPARYVNESPTNTCEGYLNEGV